MLKALHIIIDSGTFSPDLARVDVDACSGKTTTHLRLDLLNSILFWILDGPIQPGSAGGDEQIR